MEHVINQIEAASVRDDLQISTVSVNQFWKMLDIQVIP